MVYTRTFIYSHVCTDINIYTWAVDVDARKIHEKMYANICRNMQMREYARKIYKYARKICKYARTLDRYTVWS